MDYTIEYFSPLGPIILACDGVSLTGLWFTDQKYACAGLRTPVQDGTTIPVLLQAKQWLDDYWAGRHPVPDALQLAPRGTDFQRNIWHLLTQIPYGTTMTYGELAKVYATEKGLTAMSAQAVGNAVSRNPISIIIPCHRVLGANGSITGYAGGISRKLSLLDLEKSLDI